MREIHCSSDSPIKNVRRQAPLLVASAQGGVGMRQPNSFGIPIAYWYHRSGERPMLQILQSNFGGGFPAVSNRRAQRSWRYRRDRQTGRLICSRSRMCLGATNA